MRIIGGEARGRRLFAPDGTDTRPTADKTREALFSIIAFDIPDANVLDLFGGTGALALEALSRGAAFAAVSDVSPQAVKIIHKNAETVLRDEIGTRIKILKADYKKAISALCGKKFDIVFLDPPYKMADSYKDCVDRLIGGNMLSEECLIVMERSKEISITLDERMEIFDTRLYRDTAIDFARWRKA